MSKNGNVEQLGQDDRRRKWAGVQTEAPDSESIEHEIEEAKAEANPAKHLVRVVCIVCPYCDGENILQTGSGSHKVKAREIACRHCQCLFTPSETNIRTSSLTGKSSGDTDKAA
jgi:hypothetical protein